MHVLGLQAFGSRAACASGLLYRMLRTWEGEEDEGEAGAAG